MFEDITIVDLDLKKTTWSRVHSSMRTLYLKLNREPDLEWIRYFNTERESRVVPTRHGMWIEEGYIIFDCLLPNVERYHLPDFQQSIDYRVSLIGGGHRHRASRPTMGLSARTFVCFGRLEITKLSCGDPPS